MSCVCCADAEPDYEAGLSTCRRCRDRMASALRQIPRLLADLRDPDVPVDDKTVRRDDAGRRWPHHDPVAATDGTPAGPVPEPSRWSRVAGTRPAREPVNLDAVDLTSRVNHPARQLLARGVLGLDDDQVGHLSAATILDGWVRDWVERRGRGEGLPRPAAEVLCGWLGDRLDWACAEHPAVDEFADELGELFRTLMGITGWSTPPPETLSVECPSCAMLTLYRDVDLERVACGSCPKLMTEGEYAEHCRRLIEEAA